MDLDTTIVAVSSPRGNSSRVLIRASGKNVFEGVKHIGVETKQHELTTCTISLPEGPLPVLSMAYIASASYAGQDTIEIILPNNKCLIDSLIRLIIEVTTGRHAEAGEFTARAFFNGRLTLSEAEGVCATISANNDSELRGAALLREGVLNTLVTPISTAIFKMLALVEAGIDFTDEEDVVAITAEQLTDSIAKASQSIQTILDGRIAMATLQHLPQVVIAGLPNAGKSTLFNALLGHQRVVVSNTAGTTRDAIQEPVWFGDKEAMLIDIAGIEDPKNQLSSSAQETATRMLKVADIVLWCVAPRETTPSHVKHALVVHTKSDVDNQQHELAVCAISGEGILSLRTSIEQRLFSIPHPSEDAIAILPRHEQHLRDAIKSLSQAKNNYDVPELVAASLRETLNSVGSISGTLTPDEVLGEVFSSFCIGK